MPVTAHLIDLENLAGTATPTKHQVHLAHADYVSAVGQVPGDYWLVAMSHLCATHAALEWPQAGSSLKLRSGPDGADLEILDFLASPQSTRRMDQIVIASGDGIFTDAALEHRAAGRKVIVASRPEALSRRLAAAADAVVLLPPAATRDALAIAA